MERLFEPMWIRGLPIRNRVVVPPMLCYKFAGSDGYATQMNIGHYRAIAAGGPGLIVQEATCVSPSGRLSVCQLGIWEDGQIDGLRRITEAVHAEGGVIFIQLHHAGILSVDEPRYCSSDFEARLPNGAPVTGREMTLAEISLVKRQFTDACKRAELAGYDGVELHGCHSYLLSQFFNNRINRRLDAYGKETGLLALEILNEARTAVSDSFVVGVRLGGFEPALADGISHAKALARAGADFLDISYGFKGEMEPEKPKDFPYLDIIYAAQEIKASVDRPVFAVNGINSVKTAGNILSDTGVDMAGVGRATLVNYNWSNDAMRGKDTGGCLGCRECMWRIDYSKCPGRLRHARNAGLKI